MTLFDGRNCWRGQTKEEEYLVQKPDPSIHSISGRVKVPQKDKITGGELGHHMS